MQGRVIVILREFDLGQTPVTYIASKLRGRYECTENVWFGTWLTWACL